MPHEDVFQPVQRQVIAELADYDLGDQPGTGDAPSNRSRRRRGTGYAVLTVAASVLGPDVFVEFQLGRLVFQDSRGIFADTVLRPPAATAGLLLIGQVQFVPMARHTRKVQFALATPTPSLKYAKAGSSFGESPT